MLPLLAALATAGCSPESGFPGMNGHDIPGEGGGGGEGSASGLMDLGELSTFAVEMDATPAEDGTEQVPTDENDSHWGDYVENNFDARHTVAITFNGTADASVNGLPEGDTVTVSGGHVEVHAHSKGLVVTVSGQTTDGSVKIYSEKKFQLLLTDAAITNPAGAAINIQRGKCFVTLSGTNTLADDPSATYTPTTLMSDYADEVADEDMKAVFFSEDDLRIGGGTGTLTISSTNTLGKGGLTTDDALFIRPYTTLQVTCGTGAGNAVKGADGICIRGGVLNLQTAGAGTKGLKTDGCLEMEGGKVTIITTGGADTTDASDVSGCAAIKADSTITVSGGELYLLSTGQGGKGISCDDAITISGGKLRIITTGSQYGSSEGGGMGGGMGGGPFSPWGSGTAANGSVSPKGIKGDKNILIAGGDIMVRTSGTNGEGIESKATLAFNGGRTAVSAYDDGLNASTAITISGGHVFAVSTGKADGIDSNGSITATGGTIIGIASTQGSEEGIDLENATFSMTGATVISIGNSSMGMGATYSGHYVSTTVSGAAGTCCALCQNDTPLVTFALPRQYSSGNLLLSTPTLASGTYTLKSGVTLDDGTQWMNLWEGVTSISGGSSTSVTAK